MLVLTQSLDAHSQNVYDCIQSKRRERALSPNGDENSANDNGLAQSTYDTIESGSESDASVSQDTFKLHLRAGPAETVLVTVKPSTKCSSIVASFLKKTGRSSVLSKNVRLSVDGEKLEPNDSIETADLEDGDMLDIVGL